ncbi:MAG: ATP phosphoribosyltransferase [Candidatus Methanofastidiosum methylothiophilum]|uniref:ATP phosphoribosyltransferase n=1 Tax=Candidatus Methanofastidiosum methylothiophilum TaxID=1705564 RepID=A0A150IRH8_9EURY|nr:MAG: ATP phosphoribosyltransferase [Candidatus Methanofastidiosum methylthiophilus]KYC47580.1 MAG: ATP phosphoribosyltransferase [Candidatus Methanofastidiosum methylthiophilus]KYC50152.1 MAG: ATP phosphoribosyltransferase [Candidatus Methanofastidiosum methylthiophilus]
MLKIAIPKKGRLSNPCLDILKRSGYEFEDSGRKLFSRIEEKNIEAVFVRTQDIPEYVQDQVVDIGITGLDILMERGAEVEILQKMGFGKCTLTIAAPKNSPINSIEDIKNGMKIVTEFPNITDTFFKDKGIKLKVIEVSGSTEIAPYLGVSDLISDIVSTGTTLVMNNLKPISKIMESEAVLIANRDSIAKKREEIELLSASIRSVLDAQGKKYIMVNLPTKSLAEFEKEFHGLGGPTIMHVISKESLVAAHFVIDEKQVSETIQKLKRIGGTGILITPIERLVN